MWRDDDDKLWRVGHGAFEPPAGEAERTTSDEAQQGAARLGHARAESPAVFRAREGRQREIERRRHRRSDVGVLAGRVIIAFI